MSKSNSICASMTVEAAFVFPVIISAIMVFFYFFSVMELQQRVRLIITDTARELSEYGIAIEILYDMADKAADKPELSETQKSIVNMAQKLGIDTALISMAEAAYLEFQVKKKLEHEPVAIRCIEGGIAGITCQGSRLLDQNDCIDIVCSYNVAFPIKVFSNLSIPVTQRIYYRSFTGYKVESKYREVTDEEGEKDEKGQEQSVYVTETGRVYHIIDTCPSLKVVVSVVFMENISALRNEHGAKYYACEKCAEGNKPETVYICEDGNRYHYNSRCSALKRIITSIPLSEIGSKTRCKRCGGE